MALQNTCNQLDIISKLIEMHLEDIAGEILLNLSEIDIVNAVVANPKWSAVATGRARVKRLLSGKSTLLKTFYRREELLAQQTQDTTDIRSFFLKACIKYSNLGEFRAESTEGQGDFRLVFPLESTGLLWEWRLIHITDEFIVTLLAGIPEGGLLNQKYQEIHFLQAFNRWTFQLVNSISIGSTDRKQPYPGDLCVIEDGIDAALFTCDMQGKRRTFLWHFTTGKVHVFPCQGLIQQTLCIAKLVVLIWSDAAREEFFATAFKVHVEDGNVVTSIIVDGEPLNDFRTMWQFPGAEELDCFPICAGTDDDPTSVFQLRSKEDFALLQTIADYWPARLDDSFLLSENFAFVLDDFDGCNFIEVVWLVSGQVKTVYRFSVPQNLPCTTDFDRDVVTVDNKFLVLYGTNNGFSAAIWRLPSDFVETCHRHLNEGTVGITSQCDQLIVDESSRARKCGVSTDPRYLQCRLERLGIIKCYAYRKAPEVMHVTMVDSIISDEYECLL